MNLYLAGMIGSGKTTIGRHVAAAIDAPYLDLDQEMDRRLGYSFHRLVHEQGWLPFRELEYAICKDFVQVSGAIVCLGGGTVRYEWNRDLFRGTGVVLLFEASEETLIERVSRADRPRVNQDTDLAGDIRRMWRDHAETYRNAADVIYRTDEKPIDEEVADVIAMLAGDIRFQSIRSAFPGIGQSR